MSKSKKTAIIVICLIAIIALVVFFITRGTKEEDTNTAKVDEQVEEPVEEENVNVLNDGTKLNTSSNLHKTKTIEGMEISDIHLQQNKEDTS